MPSVKRFITEDEIDAALTSGSGMAGGKGRIFAFFQESHTDKEKVDFLSTNMASADVPTPCPARLAVMNGMTEKDYASKKPDARMCISPGIKPPNGSPS